MQWQKQKDLKTSNDWLSTTRSPYQSSLSLSVRKFKVRIYHICNMVVVSYSCWETLIIDNIMVTIWHATVVQTPFRNVSFFLRLKTFHFWMLCNHISILTNTKRFKDKQWLTKHYPKPIPIEPELKCSKVWAVPVPLQEPSCYPSAFLAIWDTWFFNE
jgi:hypothetical protein